MPIILEDSLPEWSYSGDPAGSRLDKIRMMIGDTLSSRPLLVDLEISFCLALSGDDRIVCAKCCENISAKLIADPNFSLGDWKEDRGALAEKYEKKARSFWTQINASSLVSGTSVTGTDVTYVMDWSQV